MHLSLTRRIIVCTEGTSTCYATFGTANYFQGHDLAFDHKFLTVNGYLVAPTTAADLAWIAENVVGGTFFLGAHETTPTTLDKTARQWKWTSGPMSGFGVEISDLTDTFIDGPLNHNCLATDGSSIWVENCLAQLEIAAAFQCGGGFGLTETMCECLSYAF